MINQELSQLSTTKDGSFIRMREAKIYSHSNETGRYFFFKYTDENK